MRGTWWRRALVAVAFGWLVAGCGMGRPPEERFEADGEPYLLVWAGDDDRQQSDFLAVIDASWESRTYGKVLRTIPVRSAGNEPQDLNGEMRADRRVFATGILSGRTFVFDLRDPMKGGLVATDDPKGGRALAAPRGVVTLPGGRTAVMCADRAGYRGEPREVLGSPGGLRVLGADGRFVRDVVPAGPRSFIVAPAGGAVRPNMNLLVTTNQAHGFAPTSQGPLMPGITVQVWSLPDLALKSTPVLEAGPRGEENLGPLMPRWFRDRPFVLVNTHEGGALYASDSTTLPNPVFRLVHDFGAGSRPVGAAITPDDRFYVTALAGANRVVALDLRDPWKPRVASEVDFARAPGGGPRRTGGPSGLAMSVDGRRVAVTSYTMAVPAFALDGDRRVYMLRLDRTSGALRVDQAFRDEQTAAVGVDFGRTTWPHGASGPARPHGVLFVAP